MSFVQLLFRRPAGPVDHAPALDGRPLGDFFRPARQIFIFVRLQELARVVVGGAVQHPVAVPRPDRHIGNRIFVARDEMRAAACASLISDCAFGSCGFTSMATVTVVGSSSFSSSSRFATTAGLSTLTPVTFPPG